MPLRFRCLVRREGPRVAFRVGKAAVRYQAFDRYDHRKSLDLAGDDAPGRFVAESGQFPEAAQDLVATKVQFAQSLHGTPGQVGFLVHQPFADGGAVLNHVGADAGLGFGVGGGFGIEDGGIRKRRMDTLVGSLRQEYGADFAQGYRSDTKLGTVLEREKVDDLSQLLKKKR